MKSAKTIVVISGMMSLLVFVSGTIFAAQVCETVQTQSCLCPDNSTGTQTCMADGSGWQVCDCLWYGIWCDDTTGLCWQDPQKDSYRDDNGGVNSFDAIRYCEELVFGGYDDWRLPTLDELRGIIKGAPLSAAGGACPITEGSALGGTTMADVIICGGRLKPFRCKGSGGCCWVDELSGTCNTIDPASTTHYLEYWSSTPAVDDPENWIGFVFFDTGTVGFNHALSFGEVRCVRDAPSPAVLCEEGSGEACTPGETRSCACAGEKAGSQICASDGACFGPCQCTGFTPSPDPEDVCEQCDEVTVTIRVPKKLRKQPYMLAAYLYAYGEVGMRPPDVGNDTNEIRYPDIDVDKPVTMVIPGCAYYRERCMSGDYYLSVYLKMNEGKFPASPEPADMTWSGAGDAPLTLNGDGTSSYEFDVTVSPVFRSW
ncbi:DUF1566 domain-containing protein [Thermodesulfobacteriota bacterium]